MATVEAKLAAEGIFGPWSQQTVRFESDIARFLGREYARVAASSSPYPVVADKGPMWCNTDALMARHYDTDLTLFRAFLDRHYMAYSMAYYGERPAAIRSSHMSLEEAQRAKLALLVTRAGIRGGQRILNIGCGFGSLETYLAEEIPGVSITAVTPSAIQASYIRDRIGEPPNKRVTAKLRLIEGDFGTLRLEPEGYDAIISVGAFEHVQNLETAMTKVASLLRPGGTCLLHYICSSQPIPRFLDSRDSLIDQYFPGGRIWPYSVLAKHTGGLNLEQQWFINGLNYWRTLDAWHQNLWHRIPEIYESSIDMGTLRHWNQFFSLCKTCFAPDDGRFLGNGQFLLRKPR